MTILQFSKLPYYPYLLTLKDLPGEVKVDRRGNVKCHRYVAEAYLGDMGRID